MPSGRTHFMAGAITAGMALYYTGGPVEYIWAGAVAALLPDADIKHSMAGKFIPLWLFCKHRGFTHSLLAFSLFSIAAAHFGKWYFISCSVGYMSHLLLDSCTPMRIPWLWPRQKNKRRRKK